MRPLYDYYRQLKKVIGGCGSTSSNKSDLALTTVSMAPAQQVMIMYNEYDIIHTAGVG